jgi:hypothetical protein
MVIMKRIAWIFVLMLPLAAFGQSTTTTGTITDTPDGSVWAGGNYLIQFVPGTPGPCTWSGGALTQQFTGALNSSGAFSVSLPTNSAISCPGNQWAFTMCPNATTGCFTVNTTVTGGSQSLSTLLSASASSPRFPASAQTYGYNTAEVNTQPKPGWQFFNTTPSASPQCNQWSGSAWQGCSSGGGGVSSVSGTANQINSTGGATPVLSLDPAIQLPGTLVGTTINNRYYVDGFTSALYPGIGQAQVAFASTNEPLCQSVSYSGSSYLAVATGNGAVTPGTNSAVWYPVQNSNTPTQLDCAFYYIAAANQTAGRASGLLLGNVVSFSSPYVTNIGLLEPQLYMVNLKGIGRGFNGGPTQIKSGGSAIMLSIPDKPTNISLPYDFELEDLDFNGNGTAIGCMQLYGFKVSHLAHLTCHGWSPTTSQPAPVIIGDGSSPYYNGGYQNFFEDIFVGDNPNAPSSWATVTASGTGTTLTFNISGTNSYYYPPKHVTLAGFSNGSKPCSTVGTISTTYTGSLGSYTLTGITMSGFSGCTGPYYVTVPDIGPTPYGVNFSLMTDSTFKDIVVASTGWSIGLFYNADSGTAIHDHVYGGNQVEINDSGTVNHFGTEPDTPTYIAIQSSGTGSTWSNTQFAEGGGGPPSSGVIGFYMPTNIGNISQSSCPNSTTTANVFSLVMNSSGPIAHGGNFGNISVMGGEECDTLTNEYSFTGKLNLPASTTSYAPVNLGAGAAPSAPVNGDLWTTSAGLYAQIGGATVGPFGTGGGTTTNALTMNNSGSGATSGTTFNGGTAQTLSYNTLGAAPLANPVLTGSGSGLYKGYGVDSGAANAYVVTLGDTSYTGAVAGAFFIFKASNSSSASGTIAINGGTARTIENFQGYGTSSGDVVSGSLYLATDNGTVITVLPVNASAMSIRDGGGSTFINQTTNTKKMQLSLTNLAASTTVTFALPTGATGTEYPAWGLSIPVGTATFASGTNVTSVGCASGYTCNNTRGTLTIVGGTATTGTIATVSFSTTLAAAPMCFASQNGGVSLFGIGNGAASSSSFTITAGVTVASSTLTVNYFCTP